MRQDCNEDHLTAVCEREKSVARFFNVMADLLELLTPLIAITIEKAVTKESK